MLKIGIGWLGLSEDQVLDMDMNSIVTGYEGKIEMLQCIFGSEESKKKQGKKKKPSAKEIRSFAKTHNAVTKATRKSDK